MHELAYLKYYNLLERLQLLKLHHENQKSTPV